MNDKIIQNMEDLREVIEENGWQVISDESGWEISKHSPAGEDFFFVINHDDNLSQAIDEIVEYAENGFDKDENIEMWIEAKNNGISGVPPTRKLVQDADDIQNMLDELRENIQSYDILNDNEKGGELDV